MNNELERVGKEPDLRHYPSDKKARVPVYILTMSHPQYKSEALPLELRFLPLYFTEVIYHRGKR
jgi:hypothetical protein